MIPWHLSLNDRGGVVVVGVFASHTPQPPPHPWHLSHIYDTLIFKFKCQAWGGGGWGVFVSHTPPPPHPWHSDLNIRGGVVVVGVYKNGKKIYRFKTEGWAQDVGCADINIL